MSRYIPKEDTKMNNSKKISTVLFFLSFTPYFILIFYFGIEGINFGMQGIAHFYGLTASSFVYLASYRFFSPFKSLSGRSIFHRMPGYEKRL